MVTPKKTAHPTTLAIEVGGTGLKVTAPGFATRSGPGSPVSRKPPAAWTGSDLANSGAAWSRDPSVNIVANIAGILGGISLWDGPDDRRSVLGKTAGFAD